MAGNEVSFLPWDWLHERSRDLMDGTGGSMMAGIRTECVAESGYGITIGGFHCPTVELGMHLDDLKKKIPQMLDVAIWEQEGHVLFLGMTRDSFDIPSHREIMTFRREPHKFFIDLPKFLASTKAQFVDRMILSGSLGSISLTLIYRPSASVSETRV